jgi:hypothetical protein
MIKFGPPLVKNNPTSSLHAKKKPFWNEKKPHPHLPKTLPKHVEMTHLGKKSLDPPLHLISPSPTLEKTPFTPPKKQLLGRRGGKKTQPLPLKTPLKRRRN